MTLSLTLVAMFSAMAASPARSESRPEPAVASVEVEATAADLWAAWTTEAGVRTFFAPAARIEPRVGGAYEIYFLTDQPPGLRGSEGATILAFEQPRRLMFSWNAPVTFGELRNQLTVVEVRFEELGETRTRVELTHSGWGDGEDWSKVRDYFARVWPAVLERLRTTRDPRSP